MLASLLTMVLFAAPIDQVPQGTLYTYRGQFAADRAEPGTLEKSFELTFLMSRRESGADLYWLLEERGQGGWSWLDRFGKFTVDGEGRAEQGVLPSLLYERAEGTSVIGILLPLLSYRESLADGVAWFERGLEHRVIGSGKRGGAEAWNVEVRSGIGRKRNVWVEKESPLVTAVNEIVFVGQGEQHSLRFELVDRQVLDEASFSGSKVAFEEWLRLRNRLQIEPQTRDIAWTSTRLAQLKADLPDVVTKSQSTILAKLARVAEQQSKAEKDRSNALSALQNTLVGKSSPQPDLEQLAGGKFAWQDLAGKVTVLHFWEYRDTPLEEPYGQVAYLDFLFRKHAGADVRVFGVVADERLAQEDTRRSGIQSARRLHSFMNLSYPLLVDRGEATRQFGDPRVTGARLPLFVVIDRAGKVIHYHVGHYEVNRDRGLEELEAIVTKALEAKAAETRG